MFKLSHRYSTINEKNEEIMVFTAYSFHPNVPHLKETFLALRFNANTMAFENLPEKLIPFNKDLIIQAELEREHMIKK